MLSPDHRQICACRQCTQPAITGCWPTCSTGTAPAGAFFSCSTRSTAAAVHAPPARRGTGAASTTPRRAPAAGRPPPAPGQRQHLITARSPIAAGARSAAMATAITNCWPPCSTSTAPGRRLLQLAASGRRRPPCTRRRRAAAPALPAPRPGAHQLLAGRRRRRANANT